MKTSLQPFRWSTPVFAFALAFAASCTNLPKLTEPIATDPLDGYKGSLPEAGVNTEMDWGNKQNLLLSEFKTLREAHSQLEKRLEQVLGENKNLTTRLANESQSLQREQSLRAQAEAETDELRKRRRDLEARILSLSLEKAKLEQTALQAKIEALKATLDQHTSTPVEAAATPPRSR
jgi:preprotein translocase subunit SecD